MTLEPKDYPKFMVWLDVETTTLDPATGVILELGLHVTTPQLEDVASTSWILNLERDQLPMVSDWSLKQHAASGLLMEAMNNNRQHTPARIAKEALQWLSYSRITRTEYVKPGTVPMCGASIHFDRAWLKIHMPELEAFFYYGNMDVSSVEKLARWWHPDVPKWEDRGLHRVLPDNEDAVAELRYYIQHGVLTGPPIAFHPTDPL